jgi:hypothetical protein
MVTFCQGFSLGFLYQNRYLGVVFDVGADG